MKDGPKKMNLLDTTQGATIEVRERRDNYAKFVIEPLERGFGITLGNSLRRILLSTIPGAAVTYVTAAPGIVESNTRRKLLPSVMPNPRSSGSITNLA